MSAPKRFITIYDTTLRDGQQGEYTTTQEGLEEIALLLRGLGIAHIEGGWPGAVRSSTRFLEAVSKGELDLGNTQVYSFCRTCKKDTTVEEDFLLQQSFKAAQNVCLFGKNSARHAMSAAGNLDKNLSMIQDSVKAAAANGLTVVYDAEHFFDGYKENKEYALTCLETALEAGASWLVLCDTNGGTFPHEVSAAVEEVKQRFPKARLGIHAHNDRNCADANSIAAVMAGCDMVQGTMNGCGERCGNADLVSVMPSLIELGFDIGVSQQQLKSLADAGKKIRRIMGMPNDPKQPYIGQNVFIHTGGVHAVDDGNYLHADPLNYGNKSGIRISPQAGGCAVVKVLAEAGIKIEKEDPRVAEMLALVEKNEENGISWRDAQASFVLAARGILYPERKQQIKVCNLSSHCTINMMEENDAGGMAVGLSMEIMDTKDATAKIADSKNPTSEPSDLFEALNDGMAELLSRHYPNVEALHTEVDYTRLYASSKKRALVKMRDPNTGEEWSTMAIAANDMAAAAKALCDAYRYHIEHRCAVKPELMGCDLKQNRLLA